MIKLNKDYSDYTDVDDNNYPEGKAIDASSSDSFDGTPLLAAYMNDDIGSKQALFKKAFGSTDGINGKPDNVNESQFVEALEKFSDDKIKKHNEKTGENIHGATVAASANQIVVRDEEGIAYANTSVSEDSDLTPSKELVNIEGLLNILSNKITPKGYVYTQLPGCPSPVDMNLYGTWVQLKFAGAFIRSEGGNAKDFLNPFSVTIMGKIVSFNGELPRADQLLVNDVLIADDECRVVTNVTIESIDGIQYISSAEIETNFSLNYTTVLIGQACSNMEHNHEFNGNSSSIDFRGGKDLNVSGSDYADIMFGPTGDFEKSTVSYPDVTNPLVYISNSGVKTRNRLKYTPSGTIQNNGSNEAKPLNITVRYWKRIA